jgi:hypothetical protein
MPVPPRPMRLTSLKARLQAVLFEVKLQRARRKRIGAFPARPLEIDEVVQEHRLALEHMEPQGGDWGARRVPSSAKIGKGEREFWRWGSVYKSCEMHARRITDLGGEEAGGAQG